MRDDQLTDWFYTVDWKRLRREDLGPSGQLTSVTDVFDRIKASFDFVLLHHASKDLSSQVFQNTIGWLRRFSDLDQEIRSFSDVRDRNILIKKIRDFEYEFMAEFGKYICYLQLLVNDIKETKPTTGFDIDELTKKVEIRLSEGLGGLKQAQPLINSLLENKEKLEYALTTAQRWLESNTNIVDEIIAKNANDSSKKSLEHKTFYVKYVDNPLVTKTPLINSGFRFVFLYLPFLKFFSKQPSWHGTIGWLISSIIFGSITLSIIAYFISFEKEVSIGNALLRISALLIPSYFALLFAQQYLNHKKLYEFYMFKNVALQTMINLRSQFPDGSSENRLILERSLNVIFSEPPVSNTDIKFDKVLLKEMVELLMRKNT